MTKTDPILTCTDDSGAKGEFYALDRSIWRELRRVQGKDKGKPYIIPENGIIRLPKQFKKQKIRIFVEIIEEPIQEEDKDDKPDTEINTKEISNGINSRNGSTSHRSRRRSKL
jgi:hypothetical protein